MNEHAGLSERFEAERPHLRAVAYRMLGSLAEAEPVGIVAARHGRLFLVFKLTLTGGKIVGIEAVADPARLHQLHLAVLDD